MDLSPSCAEYVDTHTLTVDRIHPGESYRRGNIQPACSVCQSLQGALITQAKRHEWQALMDEARAAGVEWNGKLAGAY